MPIIALYKKNGIKAEYQGYFKDFDSATRYIETKIKHSKTKYYKLVMHTGILGLFLKLFSKRLQ